MSDSVICNNCGYENVQHRTNCKKCRVPLGEVAAVPEPLRVPLGEVAAVPEPLRIDLEKAPQVTPSDFEYLVIPFVGQIRSGVFSIENAGTASKQLQKVIDDYSQRGWDFHSVNDINIQINPGCLASLLGARVSFITFDQVIFRRKRASSES